MASGRHVPPSAQEPAHHSSNASAERLQRILNDGPSTPSDYFPYEYMKTRRGDADTKHIVFNAERLQWAYRVILDGVFSDWNPHDEDFDGEKFFTDICSLLEIIAVQAEQKEIERSVLYGELMRASKERNMEWWTLRKARVIVICGIMYWGMTLRYRARVKVDGELGKLMGKTELGEEGELEEKTEKATLGKESGDMMECLANELEGMLSINP